MKFFTCIVTLTAFIAAHQGPHDAQGNHLDAQGNIIQYANQAQNQQANTPNPIKIQNNAGNNNAPSNPWIQQLLGYANNNNNNQQQQKAQYNNGHGHGPNEPCDHPHQDQKPAYKQY